MRKIILFAYDPQRKSVVIGPTLIRAESQAPRLLEYGGEAVRLAGTGDLKLETEAKPDPCLFLGPVSGLQPPAYPKADLDFAAIRDTFLNCTAIVLTVLDGPVTASGSQGLRATCMVTNFSRNEPLEEAITVSVTVKPTFSANPPSWLVVP